MTNTNMSEAGIIPSECEMLPPSPWPILLILTLTILSAGIILVLLYGINYPLAWSVSVLGAGSFLVFLYYWLKEVILEAPETSGGLLNLRNGLQVSVLIFIVAEIMLFAPFFASFFSDKFFPFKPHTSVWDIQSGVWPPTDIIIDNPWGLPLYFTLILFLSGTTITWAHHAIKKNDIKSTILGLKLTLLLAIFFLIIQSFERANFHFAISDKAIYQSNFLWLTAIHAVHVFVGTIAIFIAYLRAKRGAFSAESHVYIDMIAWYWHFVDILWLFIFIFVY